MRTFKRLTAITLSVMMILASVLTVNVFAATQFTDVAENYQYAQAISNLVGKGIINGYTEADGTSTFRPENTITRAEFAKLLVLATAPGVTHTATTNRFPDLALDHWANTFIAAAVNTGAINGYEDGTFRPENPVSYGEAVKMLVCTLGYAKVVTPTEPWYNGYINVANNIGLTKSAVALGSNEAKRGLVAQLIYNVASTKPLVQTGTGVGGSPVYRPGNDDEDVETATGVVMGVSDTTIEGISYGLKKDEVMIDNVIYEIGAYGVEKFLPLLGLQVDIEYEDSSKRPITYIEEGTNESIIVKDEDIVKINGREITYYDDNDEETLDLSSDLYVIYNGFGVEQKDIDDKFIETYLDIECGEIEFIDNDSSRDIDVAVITSYQTMFMTSSPTGTNGVYTLYDKNNPSLKTITLDNDDCEIYTVSSAGGKKTKVTSLSSASKDKVVSIAAPLSGKDALTQVIISTAKVTGEIIETSKYEYTIGDKDYELSAYYESLGSEFDLKEGNTGTFYLDYTGKIVYYKKSSTNSSIPYGYLITAGVSGYPSSVVKVEIFEANSTKDSKVFTIPDDVEVNGETKKDAEDVLPILKANAEVINAKMPSEMKKNAEYSQLVKYKANSDDVITELYTIDPVDSGNGGITYDVSELSDGSLYAYNGSGKFTNGGTSFNVSSSPKIFSVPFDRSAEPSDAYGYTTNRTNYFVSSTKYIVEPYDKSGTNATVVIRYYDPDNTSLVNVTFDGASSVAFVESIGEALLDGDSKKKIDKITYINGTSLPDTRPTLEFDEKVKLADYGIKVGDVIRYEMDDNKKYVVAVQKLFSADTLYTVDSDGKEKVESDNLLEIKYSSTADYFIAVYGTVNSIIEGDSNDDFYITPDGDDIDDRKEFKISDSTKVFVFEKTGKNEDDKEFVEKSRDILVPYYDDEGEVNKGTPSKVFAFKQASNNILKAIYIIE